MKLLSAPSHEWDKVIGYIRKKSTFDKVASACRHNPSKLKWRYMILKELGLTQEAEFFIPFLSSREVKEYNSMGVNIPENYAEQIDEWQMNGFGPFSMIKSQSKITKGPLAVLTSLGICFDMFRYDLSDDERGVAASLGIKPWDAQQHQFIAPGQASSRTAKPYIVVLYNSTVDNPPVNQNYFYFVEHSTASRIIGYSIGINPEGYYGEPSSITGIKEAIKSLVVAVNA